MKRAEGECGCGRCFDDNGAMVLIPFLAVACLAGLGLMLWCLT